ncbi:MAG: beta-hydroxyacyl-ACP dehydratase [Pirellulales bacterium]|nr:beta-hydroxyacyl-ACP dehydratase [Pirellulales bacterium]
MSTTEIRAAIPHREPFLLIDEIIEQSDERVICRKTFVAHNWCFTGHFPEFPLVPGVLLCEAALQAGAVLMSRRGNNGSDTIPVVTRMNNVRFKRTIRPDETIEIDVQLREKLADAFYFDAQVTCDGKLAVRFDFACMLASRSREPSAT